ncbi:MAG: coproporphyrinogen dehydrogenase HemZ [Lachnospiraceae bacterium]|nr:coproporphyrinogen dehydrogenase HemZ [Lachnospiraceae bacterium]
MGRLPTLQLNVIISGFDMTQEVGPLIKSFYPGADTVIRFSNGVSSFLPDMPINTLDGKISEIILNLSDTSFTITINGKKENTIPFNYVDVPDEHMVYEKRRKRAYKNLLLKELYIVLSRETGRTLPWGILTGVRPTKLLFERLKKGTVGNITYMTTEYLCSPKKAGLAQKTAARELEILNRFDYKNGYSLYVGFPFCPSICNYCSFGSHPIDRYGDLVQAYIDALLKEIDKTCGILKNKKLQTIYFGGGTPTAVSAEQLKSVIGRVKQCFDMSDVLEFTVEAGRPDSIDAEKLQMLKEEGITRISINPQSMCERTLELIGRKHTAKQTMEAFNLARSMGFDNINMDLIAGLTGESFSDMKYTLDEVGKLAPDCITVHTLALKRAARLTTQKELYAGQEASDVEKMVDYAADFCMERGYEPYYLYRQKNMTENLENVGYALPGKEGLYNILIMEEVQQILALGAGASSKFIDRNVTNGRRFGRIENVKNVSEYINRIDEMTDRKLECFTEVV